MVKLLLLMSSLRSGSHMVRSMLRDEPTFRDLKGEHAPLAVSDIEALVSRPETTLVPLKYGHLGLTGDCLALAAAPQACALILHRRDAVAQACSLATAQRFGTWFGPVPGAERVTVSAADTATLQQRNNRDLSLITAALQIPHAVLAYEDITVGSLGSAVARILGRQVIIKEPTTLKTAAGR